MTYTQRRLELLEHITDQHNAIDITRIPDNYYEQIKTLLSTSIAQAVAEERKRVVGEIEKRRKEVYHFPSSYSETLEYKEDVGYNQALDDLLSSLQDKPLIDNK